MPVILFLVEPTPKERTDQRASLNRAQRQVPCPHHGLIVVGWQRDVTRAERVGLFGILLDTGV